MHQNEPVVIVHGLWVHGIVMRWLARRIAQDGFEVHVYSYPSMRLTLTQNAERLRHYCQALGAPRVRIVAHSMGGLIALRMLERSPAPLCSRLVLGGTPYAGSVAAERLAHLPGGLALLGRSMAEYLKAPHPALPPQTQVGVIAGTHGIGLGRLVAPGLPRPNDGVVTLEETTVPGMQARVALHVSHTMMLISNQVARQCCAFLRSGRFLGQGAGPGEGTT